MFQALRIPDFRLLWGGGLISSLGSWLLVLAIPAHILAATGSLRDTGLTLTAEYLPQLMLGPVAGAVADGWDRRRLMIGANLFCAGAVAVMLLGTSPGRSWVLYAALVAESSGTVLYTPAIQARIPAIVGTGPLLSSANSLTSASGGIVRLIGGPLGGVLLGVSGIRWLICADALSYLLAAVAMFMTSRSGAHQDRTAEVSAVARDLIEGTRVLRAQPVARVLLPVTVIFLTANASLSAVLIPFGVQRLGGSEHTGLLLSCLGAGFLLGAPVIRAFLDRAEPRNLLTASLTATAGAYFLLFTSSSLATALPAATAVGMSGSMSLVIQQTILQRVIPGAVLGRVSAVFLTGEAAATLAGSVAGPFIAQAAHLVAVAAAASLITLSAAALAFLTVPQMPAIVTRGPPQIPALRVSPEPWYKDRMIAVPSPAQPDAAGDTQAAAAAVHVAGLRKRYGSVAAVDGIDLTVRTGEFFTLLGPSGSGKTTLLRLIAGFERPDAGRVVLGGTDVTNTPPYARNVNTVFQDYALFPHMTVWRNIEYGLRVRRVPRAERREKVDRALEMVRLPGLGSRKPAQLSGGQRQRVALARAIVNEPEVLLLDEPLGALDLKLRQEMQLELLRVQREVGVTFVYVTHDQEEALTMSDRIAVLNQGSIEQIGTPVEVYERPRTAFVAGFIGVSNLIERAGRRMTVRPEKITLLEDGAQEPPGMQVEQGRIRDVIYAGVLTRYVVDLDAGGELVVSRQNAEAPGVEDDPRNHRVRIAWRADQAFTIPQGPDQGPTPGEGNQ